MKIAIGGDHAGFSYKKEIKKYLTDKGHELTDYGTDSLESTDYPDYAHPLSESVENKTNTLGILICGSGNGVCMTANKHQQVRAALCWNTQIAFLSRLHNDANVICIPARFVALELAYEMIDMFIDTKFEAGRHERRVNKICL
ncbi:UNVERIFIED_CONTAM: hypothetical protein GTU68_014757 [Idotea baltica]|nr:hypothetical protein [Idotea baltica]